MSRLEDAAYLLERCMPYVLDAGNRGHRAYDIRGELIETLQIELPGEDHAFVADLLLSFGLWLEQQAESNPLETDRG